MNVINEAHELRKSLQSLTHQQSLALVPTMGNLHEAHLQLIRKAQELADAIVVSIFVNPLQFAPNEDFSTYPRTLEEDLAKLSSLGVDFVFTPDTNEMYPTVGNHTKVSVPKISDEYCGRFRPSFFYGVTTVVTKLFNIVQPNVAIFGEKDFQQLHIIKKMVQDLSFPIQIISMPLIREQDGLAMSSRNQYLTSEERVVSCEIYKTLCRLHDALLEGNKDHEQLIQFAMYHLMQHSFKVDYLHICNHNTLEIAHVNDKDLVILIAAWLGRTRLIDNLPFSLV